MDCLERAAAPVEIMKQQEQERIHAALVQLDEKS
jgi:hypothetical protein